MGELQEALSALGGRLEEVRDTRGRLRQLAAAQQQQAQQQAPALPPSNMTSVPSNDAHKVREFMSCKLRRSTERSIDC